MSRALRVGLLDLASGGRVPDALALISSDPAVRAWSGLHQGHARPGQRDTRLPRRAACPTPRSSPSTHRSRPMPSAQRQRTGLCSREESWYRSHPLRIEGQARREHAHVARRGHSSCAGTIALTRSKKDLEAAPIADLFRVCVDEGRLLVTLDRGFGDVRLYPPGTHHGIVVLRPHGQSAAMVVSLVGSLLEEHELTEFARANVVVDEVVVRIRRD